MLRVRKIDLPLRQLGLNPLLNGKINNVIGFLNGIKKKFPDAISFAAGMPDENHFDVKNLLSSFDTYLEYVASSRRQPINEVANMIGQYNNTKGIVNDLIAKYLKRDQDIKARANEIIVTVGAQEAFAVIVATLCDRNKDVILVQSPSYIGVSGFSKVFGYHVDEVDIGADEFDFDSLEKKILAINNSGRCVKLLYTIPDYHNPTGYSLSRNERLKLLEMASKHNFLIIEDSTYNTFVYDGKRNPTLKSLDQDSRVIYVGSFSKLLFPGLRLGVIMSDQSFPNHETSTLHLVDEMAKVKGQITNNTSTISQAILAGVLIRENYSLRQYNKAKIRTYKARRDAMLMALNTYMPTHHQWCDGISWNRPSGGFFIRMKLPFPFTEKEVHECAEHYGVIVCPMTHFYLDGGGANEIRLTFSNTSTDEITTGVKRLVAFLQAQR